MSAAAAARLSCDEFLATTAENTPSLGWKSDSLHSRYSWVGMNGHECARRRNMTIHYSSDLSGHKAGDVMVSGDLERSSDEFVTLSCLDLAPKTHKLTFTAWFLSTRDTFLDLSGVLWDCRCQGTFSNAWNSQSLTFSWSFPCRLAPKMEAKQFTASSSNFLLYCSFESTEEKAITGRFMTIMEISPSLHLHYYITPQSLPSYAIQLHTISDFALDTFI